ncbi:50S ribosomal protein L9 [bacterium]|jgi:large subunit ribosomal protein L9|nr:50S ribosomal protein L9 [bacterium]MBT4121393.1 50S ribosomal protein L9 [bacterium]MBT4335165.1 50S ribosomal protein L9 [bacterium]MBT4495906.1 50S ribosomal protein L9 [bacterium]MBT4764074.1 50S ribosomal protein L9 [bacterium]
MKVILIEDVKSLGEKGDVKNVANGYARNFLIPQGQVKRATKENIAELNKLKEKSEVKEAKVLKNKVEVTKKLKKVALNFKAKASETGHLFAAINSKDIASELLKKGIKVKASQLVIDKPLKEVGNNEIKVKINNEEVVLNIKIEAIK